MDFGQRNVLNNEYIFGDEFMFSRKLSLSDKIDYATEEYMNKEDAKDWILEEIVFNMGSLGHGYGTSQYLRQSLSPDI